MKKVYVVSFESNSSGGFDWYHTDEHGQYYLEKEKIIADDFSGEDYKVYYSVHEVDGKLTNEEITDIIDIIVNSDEFKPIETY